MSDYWVSNKKYFCKYCDIFIADDAPSRTHHENGLRHQGNKERFIRALYKTGEKSKRDAEEEAREIARIEQAAQAVFVNDVQSGHAKASTSAVPASSKPSTSKSTTKPSGGVYANYTTAKDLGIAQDEEKLAAEALERQQSQGVVGQWEVVESTPSTSSVLPQKRPHQQEEEDEEGEGFKIRRRKLTEGLGQIYDPGKIVIAPRKDEDSAAEKVEESASDSKNKLPSERLVWSTKKWKVGTAEGHEDGDTEGTPTQEEIPMDIQAQLMPSEDVQLSVPPEEKVPKPIPEPSPDPPVEPVADAAPAKSMFKKRKAPGQPVGQKSGLRKQL